MDTAESTHTRTATPAGPDYCAECSERLGDWVPWPCRPAALVAGMTRREADTWEAVRLAAVSYLALTDVEPAHSMEREEVCHAFHSIQGWLAQRPFMRALDGAFGG